MFSQTEENYIKAIYSISLHSQKSVSTNDIAKKLATKASSVTDMIQKLSEKKLVSYQKYQGVNLTSKGVKIAIKVVRKHRLWEVFLVKNLNYNWDEVHELAEQLEHIKSDSLVDKLDEYLNFPTHDPHGDPIPDKNGNMQHHKNVMLSSIEVGKICKVVGVIDSSATFLKYLDKVTIQLGSVIKVLSIEEFDLSRQIEINGKVFSISHQITQNIYVNNI